ncbi:hypothetical protein LCGC14_1954530 [marine sediment metagenome]|uniref:Transposase IS3/IS911 family protein n=1 Tax=marine sediment metagenome TaxID=412755 RepID=A0A0F9FGE6_9ZZZZ
MVRKRRRFSGEFKARVVRAALREDKTLAQLAGEFDVHPNQITEWKRHAIEALPDVFGRRKPPDREAFERREGELYRKIGQLNMELDWMKKKGKQLGIDC